MRKLLIAALISASTPAMAHDYGYYDTYHHEWVEPRYERHYDHRHDHDDVTPLLGGLILGVLIANAKTQDQPKPRDEYRYDKKCDCYHR